MTTTATALSRPRKPALDHPLAMRLAADEYQRFIDVLAALSPHDWTKPMVEERRHLTPAEVLTRFRQVAPRAARARRRIPGLIRRRTVPEPQLVGDHEERWTVGYMTDVILTRDPWMHRVDITRATGADLVLTPEHDGVIVADVVQEWAQRHGQPHALHLSGPAGGSWTAGAGAAGIDLDGIEFCRTVSGRAAGAGLLQTQVPF